MERFDRSLKTMEAELTDVAEMGSRLSAKTRIFLDGTPVIAAQPPCLFMLPQLCLRTFLDPTRNMSSRHTSHIQTLGLSISYRRSSVRMFL